MVFSSFVQLHGLIIVYLFGALLTKAWTSYIQQIIEAYFITLLSSVHKSEVEPAYLNKGEAVLNQSLKQDGINPDLQPDRCGLVSKVLEAYWMWPGNNLWGERGKLICYNLLMFPYQIIFHSFKNLVFFSLSASPGVQHSL